MLQYVKYLRIIREWFSPNFNKYALNGFMSEDLKLSLRLKRCQLVDEALEHAR